MLCLTRTPPHGLRLKQRADSRPRLGRQKRLQFPGVQPHTDEGCHHAAILRPIGPRDTGEPADQAQRMTGPKLTVRTAGAERLPGFVAVYWNRVYRKKNA